MLVKISRVPLHRFSSIYRAYVKKYYVVSREAFFFGKWQVFEISLKILTAFFISFF